MPTKSLQREGNQIILHTTGVICSTTRELASSKAFEKVVKLYIKSLQEQDSLTLSRIKTDDDPNTDFENLLALLQSLAVLTLEDTAKILPFAEMLLDKRQSLNEFVEELYNFWRVHDRFMVCHSEQGPDSHDQRPYRTFNATEEQLTHLVRSLYRDIAENITGDHPRVYRQVSAGCQVALIAIEKQWNCPTTYAETLYTIPIIRQVLINPPLILNPPMNKRTGQFAEVAENPLLGLSLKTEQWLCYPAQVGPIVVFIYFHQKFIGLASSLANLFELATDEQVAAGPDAIYLYGVPSESMVKYGDLPTVFHDDALNGIMVGAVPDEDRFGYFGYLKKMVLTLHNIVMMKRGRMPYHGAMVRIEMKNGATANVLLMGDTAAGKSESLEAFRILGVDRIRDLRVIADDMGSLAVSEDGQVLGYGTEIGAFIRLDDLQHGYAFRQIDRAIIHSPHQTNARVILPVTTQEEVLRGYPVNYILYANNYDNVDENHPIVEHLTTVDRALEVFREGAVMAKGTTTSSGLVRTYFANIFGPQQYQNLHEGLARKTFEAAFKAGVYVGQMRTRLGVPGYEATGPHEAAKALFKMIADKK
jgi:hypothetical protein